MNHHKPSYATKKSVEDRPICPLRYCEPSAQTESSSSHFRALDSRPSDPHFRRRISPSASDPGFLEQDAGAHDVESDGAGWIAHPTALHQSQHSEKLASPGLSINFSPQELGDKLFKIIGSKTHDEVVQLKKKESQQAGWRKKRFWGTQSETQRLTARVERELRKSKEERNTEALCLVARVEPKMRELPEEKNAPQDCCSRLRKAYQDQQQQLEKFALQVDNKELFLGQQQSDSDIEALFMSLFIRVKSWSLAFCSDHEVDKQQLRGHPDFRPIMSEIAPGDTVFKVLDGKETRKLCVQGIVGNRLSGCIFRRVTSEINAPSIFDQWSQGHADAIGKIERALFKAQPEITPRELNDWRAFTVALVSRMEARINGNASHEAYVPKEAVNYHSASVLEMISTWAKSTDLEVLKKIKTELDTIFEMAIEMALVFRKQRACWLVKPQSGGFDPRTMEDIDDEDEEEGNMNKTVALVIFPGLFKQGNADGEHYDIESCVVKALVKCVSQG